MSEEFTIQAFKDLVESYQAQGPREYVVAMSFKVRIHWDVCIQMSFYKIPGRMWFTDTDKAIDWIEITPYSKGNLWKIRCLYNKLFHVYFGTIKKAYCTTLEDALKLIPPIQ